MIGSGAQRERSLCAAVTGWLTGMNAGQWSNFKDFCGTRFYSTHAFRLEQAACREGSRGLEVAYTWVLGIALLLGSMHFWSWWKLYYSFHLKYIYLKYIGKFIRTGISTLNGHISETVQNFEKLKNIRCNYFLILCLDRWFQNFPQCVFCHFWLIWVRFWSFFGCSR